LSYQDFPDAYLFVFDLLPGSTYSNGGKSWYSMSQDFPSLAYIDWLEQLYCLFLHLILTVGGVVDNDLHNDQMIPELKFFGGNNNIKNRDEYKIVLKAPLLFDNYLNNFLGEIMKLLKPIALKLLPPLFPHEEYDFYEITINSNNLRDEPGTIDFFSLFGGPIFTLKCWYR